MQYQAGDPIALHLHITPTGAPVDDTTTATVRVLDDSGTDRRPTAYPSEDGDRSRWTAILTDAPAGELTAVWTVTGTGAGVEHQTLLVAPAPEPGARGRVYATTADLARHLGAAPPTGAGKLLEAATETVDGLLLTARYPVDDDGLPTEPAHAAALRDAVCAQVAWWGETGDETGSGAIEHLGSVRIGSVSIGGGSSTSSSGPGTTIAPRARQALAQAGLLGHGPRMARHGTWC